MAVATRAHRFEKGAIPVLSPEGALDVRAERFKRLLLWGVTRTSDRSPPMPQFDPKLTFGRFGSGPQRCVRVWSSTERGRSRWDGAISSRFLAARRQHGRWQPDII